MCALVPRGALCRPTSPFSDLSAMPKYPETQLHVQTYLDRLVYQSFNHPGRRSRKTLIPHPGVLPCHPGGCWREGAGAKGQVVNKQEKAKAGSWEEEITQREAIHLVRLDCGISSSREEDLRKRGMTFGRNVLLQDRSQGKRRSSPVTGYI